MEVHVEWEFLGSSSLQRACEGLKFNRLFPMSGPYPMHEPSR